MITIAMINQSSVVTQAELGAFIAAEQKHLTADFIPAWGLDAVTITLCTADAIPAGAWPHYLLDTSDQAGDLAYHEDDGSLPVMKTFCLDAKNDGEAWTVAADHEIKEALVDPQCSRVGPDGVTAMECADPVEESTHTIDGVELSDHVLPAWFQPGAAGPYDFQNHLTAPLTLEPGGYLSRVNPATGQWTTQQAMRRDGKLSRHDRAMWRGTSRLLKRQAKADTARAA